MPSDYLDPDRLIEAWEAEQASVTADRKDPREAVLLEGARGSGGLTVFSDGYAAFLASLDAADPLRAMLGDIMEVVGWVAGAAMVQGDRAQMTDPNATHRLSPGAWLTIDTRTGVESMRRTRIAATLYEHLTRIRTLTPTEGDGP